MATRNKVPTRRSTKPKEGARRYEFVLFSLRVTPAERKELMRDEECVHHKLKELARKRSHYEDFAATPQEDGRAVFMSRLSEEGRYMKPVLMRVSYIRNGVLYWGLPDKKPDKA